MTAEEQKTYFDKERTRLANERTFLAYIRTAIAFLVLGGAALHFLGSDSISALLGVFALALGTLILGIGFMRFYQGRSRILGSGS